MTKKKLSQNKTDIDEKPAESITNNTSTEKSENLDKSKRKAIYKGRFNYIFTTPIKKMKSHLYIPMTPKKKNRAREYIGLPIIGKNLLNIFDSM